MHLYPNHFKRFYFLLFIFFTCVIVKVHAEALMVSPSIDEKPNEPFSYASESTDQIGLMDIEGATEITPEGYLYTGFGELMFFTGIEQKPVYQRIRTLEKGYLPIIHYTIKNDGIDYHFTLFTAGIKIKERIRPVNFIRVEMTNTESIKTRARLTLGIRYQKNSNVEDGVSDNRFRRPEQKKKLGGYNQLGKNFNENWVYRFERHSFIRDNKILYLFDTVPQEKAFTLKNNGYVIPDLLPRALKIMPTTPVGITSFNFLLSPKEKKTLFFKMPVIPLESAFADQLLQANFDNYKVQVSTNFEKILHEGMQITLPEKKVVDTFNASLIYDLLAREKVDNAIIQYVNKLHYHEFFLRDAADIAYMYDVTGYPNYALDVINFFEKMQLPDGNFLSHDEQYDGFGQVLWTYAKHYRLTHDASFAKKILPQVKRALAWLKQARQKDALHLIPNSNVKDNENLPGHITGYNFIALGGLKATIEMTSALNETHFENDLRKEYDDFYHTFMQKLTAVTEKTSGYIPPVLDVTNGGQDWGNLLGTYPEPILPPWDKRISATLKKVRNQYQEGLMTYRDGRYLHHYLTIKNTLTALIRNEDEQVIKEFYSVLLHTSSTHAGFEFCIRPWGDRNFHANLAPHGWFAADYRTLLRNMLLREYEGDLHLLSALSPAWIGKGKRISVTNGVTEFGRVNFTLDQPTMNDAELKIESQWKNPPKNLIIHLPWFIRVNAIMINGKTVPLQNRFIKVSPLTKSIQISWRQQNENFTNLSYKKTVANFKRKYKKHYLQLLHSDN